jgi:hypothetical protein
MNRFSGLVLSFVPLTPALAINEPDNKVIDLRVEGEIDCLMSIFKNGEVYTISALIERVESGEIE